MIINLTLVVQALNFWLFYFLLRVFLFKPVLAAINSDNAREQNVHNLIDEHNKSIEIKRHEQELLYNSFRDYCEAKFPQHVSSTAARTPTGIERDYDSALLDKDSFDALVEVMSITVQEGIKNVH